MSAIPEGLGGWLAAAVGLFWFVGAYNRLVRLRAQAMQAFGTLDGALSRQIDYVQGQLAEEPAQADPVLAAAIGQLATLLAVTRTRPLDAGAVLGLATALHAMLGAWARHHPDQALRFEPDGTLSRPVALEQLPVEPPGTAPLGWPEPSAAAEMARDQFNRAVERYNAAIRQFPTVLLAWLFRMRVASPLV